MSNLHATQATAVTVVTTAETVIATLTPFTENQGLANAGTGDLRNLQVASGPGAQGVLLSLIANCLIGTGATAAVLRLRVNTLTGTIIATTQTLTVVAGQTVNLDAMWLDAVLSYPNGVQYVVTLQMTGASGNTTVNLAVLTGEDANSFE